MALTIVHFSTAYFRTVKALGSWSKPILRGSGWLRSATPKTILHGTRSSILPPSCGLGTSLNQIPTGSFVSSRNSPIRTWTPLVDVLVGRFSRILSVLSYQALSTKTIAVVAFAMGANSNRVSGVVNAKIGG
jgi:hypothetical protein